MIFQLVELECVNTFKHSVRGTGETLVAWINVAHIQDVRSTTEWYSNVVLDNGYHTAVVDDEDIVREKIKNESFQIHLPFDDLIHVEIWEGGGKARVWIKDNKFGWVKYHEIIS